MSESYQRGPRNARDQWRPILTGESAAFVFREAIDIAKDLASRRHEDKSLAFQSDLGLLFAYLAVATGHDKWFDLADQSLSTAQSQLDSLQSRYLSLYGGLLNFGWTVEHAYRLLEGPDSAGSTNLEALDDLVRRRLIALPEHAGYDLVSGFVGVGVYFLERLPAATAVAGLSIVLDRLAAAAIATADGLTWFTPPEHLPQYQRDKCPDGYYNLGVAHGVTGVAYLLAQLSAHGPNQSAATELLAGCLRWILSQRRPAASLSLFSSWSAPGQDSGDSRLGWCYGDLGMAGVLHQVAAVHQTEDIASLVAEMTDRCSRWPDASAHINDAGLCHGAVGVGHIFNVLAQATGQPRYEETAATWIGRAPSYKKPQAGIAGYLPYQPTQPHTLAGDASFLAGAVGIALGYLAAVTSIAPAWDRRLLLSCL